jgi:hypothetical protein
MILDAIIGLLVSLFGVVMKCNLLGSGLDSLADRLLKPAKDK